MSKPKISQNIEQGLSLSPQQLIRANILQLNSIMLEARLYQELESNPALEIIENEPVQDSDDIENDQEDSSIDYNDDDYDNWYTSPKTNDDYDATLNLKNQSTLFDQVMSVLRDENLNDDEITAMPNLTSVGTLSIALLKSSIDIYLISSSYAFFSISCGQNTQSTTQPFFGMTVVISNVGNGVTAHLGVFEVVLGMGTEGPKIYDLASTNPFL